MSPKIFIALLFLLNYGGKLISQDSIRKGYEIILKDEIYVEQYDSFNTSKWKYTFNNKCFVGGNSYLYDYYYQNVEGDKFKFEPLEVTSEMNYHDRQRAWRFVSVDSVNEKTIDKILLTIDTDSNNILYSFPGFEQSVIKYEYLLPEGIQGAIEGTGLIENENNIWMHPPRSLMLSILELNPFPFIQIPYTLGNKWEWTLNKVGEFYGDERWRTWDGTIDIKNNYKITGKKSIKTKLGEIECFEIQATGLCPLGTTYLTAYFNFDLGFVKLDYTNIDSTKVVLELFSFSPPDQ